MDNWTDIYEDEDYERWFKFIKKNIYDLPYYEKNKWRFGPSQLEKLKQDKNWIYKTYESLSIFYAEKATNIIIDYVNRTFQDGLLNITRGTLDFIVSLFGENIVEEFVDKDLSIEHLKEIVMEEFSSERYELVAYLICKEPKLNLAENSRIKYKWQLSNSLESKQFNLELLNFTDPMKFGPLRQSEMKEIFKGASEQTKREIESYEKNMKKNWNICLPNERLSSFTEWIKDRKKCIMLPYIRKDITYDDLADIKNKIKHIHEEMALLLKSDPSLSKEELQKKIHKIYVKYDLREYILPIKNKKPNLTELKLYASILKIKYDKHSTSSELAFLILLNSLFPELDEEFHKAFGSIKEYIKLFVKMQTLYNIFKKRVKPSNSGFKIPDIYNQESDRIPISDHSISEKKVVSNAMENFYKYLFLS